MRQAFLQYELSQQAIDAMPADGKDIAIQFKASLEKGCADGEMDIGNQENLRGYYAHLAEIDRLADINNADAIDYAEKLLQEIDDLADDDSYMVYVAKVIKNQVIDELKQLKTSCLARND